MAISFLIILAFDQKRVYMIPIYLLAAIGISISLIAQNQNRLVGLENLIFSDNINKVCTNIFIYLFLLLLFIRCLFI